MTAQPGYKAGAICTQDRQDNQKLDNIKAALSELVLSNKGSWFSKAFRQLGLRQACLVPNLDQVRKQVFVGNSMDASSQ